jgi:hypothetical protein
MQQISLGEMMNNLQQALISNAIFSTSSAAVFVLFNTELANATGIPGVVLYAVALMLVVFAAILLYGAFGPYQRWVGRVAVVLDVAWVVMSVAVLLWPVVGLLAAGRWAIIGIAVVVAGFAAWQQQALQHLRGQAVVQ